MGMPGHSRAEWRRMEGPGGWRRQMKQRLEYTIAILERTPAAVDALLRGLPEAWLLGNEGERTWSPRDTLGHYIHCERADWMPRARSILEDEGVRDFPPFDRAGHLQTIGSKCVEELLDEFREIRATNIDELRGWDLGVAEVARRGRH